MSYQKYTTEAVVLNSFQRGESDKVLVLYTCEFGLLYARAAGIRREGSRMRYAVQDFAHASVSLVRGKGGWRLAGASALRTASLPLTRGGAKRYAHITQLVRRLVHGEGENTRLFETLTEARRSLAAFPKEQHSTIELISVARILHALGYLSADALGSALFANTAFDSMQLEEAERLQKELLRSINEAIAESQL